MTNLTNKNLKHRYFNLEVASISSCNMKCTYCFEGEELQSKQKQTNENLFNIIVKIKNLLDDPNFNAEYDGVCINFWGGEPTLNFEWNKELIEKTKEAFNQYESKVTYFIYSNGFNYVQLANHIDLFSKEELLNNVLRVQISYDGIPNGRIDHRGRPTDEVVLGHIKTFAKLYPELNLSTKATIQPQELQILERIWLSYFKLYEDKDIQSSRVNVIFSPTLNYVDDFDDTNEDYLKTIHFEFQKITKLEMAFHNKYGHHLFEWFSNDFKEARQKRLTNCTAGINLLAVDYDGQISSCHGVLYSDKKEDFENFHDMNINQPKEIFIRKFFSSREALKQHADYVADECISCNATVCYKCPVVNIEQTGVFAPSNFQLRDKRHCQIYKTFGSFDRVMMTHKLNIKENQ